MTFKPMLSGKAEPDKLRFPLLASPKIDGIRCLIMDGVAMSRTLKPIPNAHVQRLLGKPEYNGLDGELIVGAPTDPDVYVKTNSGVMSRDGEPEFTYLVFDRWDLPNDSFEDRYAAATPPADAPFIQRLEHTFVTCKDELEATLMTHQQAGYEGTMLRAPTGPYKHGRSTVKEGWLLKCKSFEDAEAEILGVVEEMHNANEATIDELGHTKRSSHQANKIGKGTMGALRVRALGGQFGGVEFHIGTGFTAAQRAEEWRVGEIVKFKYMAHGSKDAPRHPVFLGRRHAHDVGDPA